MKCILCGTILAGLTVALPGLPHAQVHDAEFERVAPEALQDGVNLTCILQDHLGFLWVGTDDALGRYDGYEITVYRHEAEDSSSIISARLQSILIHGLEVGRP